MGSSTDRRVLGAVLAGGQSSRMGVDKAAIDVGGVTMFDRAAAALRGAGCQPIVAIGGPERSGVDRVDDLHPGAGPLGGILTALTHADQFDVDAVAVLACDMPRVPVDMVRVLLEADDGGGRVVAAKGERIEPLCSVWPLAVAGPVGAAFSAGERSVRGVLALLDPVLVPVEPDGLINVNTPADLDRLEADTGDERHPGQPSGGGSVG